MNQVCFDMHFLFRRVIWYDYFICISKCFALFSVVYEVIFKIELFELILFSSNSQMKLKISKLNVLDVLTVVIIVDVS